MSETKRPTMNDVAARAGVSRALVSIVMREAPGASEATRAAVLAAAEELGYSRDEGARSLRTGRSDLIGVVFDIRDDFHADLVEAAYPAAASRGCGLSLSAVTTGRSQQQALAALIAQRVDGVLVLGSRTTPAALAEAMEGLRAAVPLVVVGGASSPTDHSAEGRAGGAARVDVVRSDERAGVHDVVEHLLALGHRDLVCLQASGHPAGAERVRAFTEAVVRHNLGGRAHVMLSGFTHADGRTAAAALLAAGQLPSAVLAANDACAAGVVQTLRAAGIAVPEQVSVVGFDGSQVALASDLNLTTVVQDATGLADLAVAVLSGSRAAVAAAVTAAATAGLAAGGDTETDAASADGSAVTSTGGGGGTRRREHVLRPALRIGATTGSAS